MDPNKVFLFFCFFHFFFLFCHHPSRYASRILSAEEFKEWHTRYRLATQTLGDRDAELAAVAEEVEKEMTIVGATAVEDELQDNVAHTIVKLRHAGIKLWVCTGDKLETAVNIGYSCRVLTPVRVAIV